MAESQQATARPLQTWVDVKMGFDMSLFYCVNTCQFVRELLSE